MAKIEAWAKDVNEGKFNLLNEPQHLYLIFVSDENNKEILRGSPEKPRPFPNGDLNIIRENYTTPGENKKTYDWNDGGHIGQTILTGKEEDLRKLWNDMWQRGQEINQEKYDYELLVQNSNTAVLQMAIAASLDDEIQQFINKNELWAPALTADLEHSKFERNYDMAQALSEAIILKYKNLKAFKEKLKKEGINPYEWLFKIVTMLKLTLQDVLTDALIDLMKQLLYNIDTLKPIIVLKESDTGRNEIFVDILTGKLMDRKTFVNAIRQDQYPGYHISEIAGVLTPVSNPDKVTSNNLG